MAKESVNKQNSICLGGIITLSSISPKRGENINCAILESVLDHKNDKNNS